MGGYVARLGQWQHFDAKWRRLLKRNGVSHIHIIDVLNGRNEFRGWTQDRALQLWQDAEKITSKHTLFGFATLVSDKDYLEIYAAGPPPKKVPLDTRYGLCFRLIMNLVFKKIYEEERRDDLTLNMVLEAGAENAGDAERIFNLFKKHAPPHLAKMAGTITFGGKDVPGLQAADGTASSVFRLEQHPHDQPYHGSEDTWDEPISVGRARINGRTPVYRIEASHTILRQLREAIDLQDQARTQSGRGKSRSDSRGEASTS
jgi:hypothetical protein